VRRVGRGNGRADVEGVSDSSILDPNGLQDLFASENGVSAGRVDVQRSDGDAGTMARVLG